MGGNWKKGYTRYRAFFLDIYRVYKARTDIRVYLEIMLSLVTVSFFAYFALKPTAFTITQLLEEIKSKEEVLAVMDQKVADLKVAQGVYQSEQSRIALINEALPDVPSPEAFARQIEGLSAKSGITLSNLVMGDVVLVGDPSQKPPSNADFAPLPEGSLEISFSLTITGPYTSIQSFLKDLENLRRPSKVDYTVVSVSQSAENRSLSMSVTGRIPYFVKK